MKRILAIALMMTTLTFASCSQRTSTHEAQWSQDGKDSVVHVNYRQDNGQFTDFFMNYMMFQMLFNHGGYNNVYHYYQSHPSEYTSRNNGYYTSHNYSAQNSPTYKAQQLSSSSPSRGR